MSMKSVLKAESLKMKGLLTSLFMRAHADDGDDDPPAGGKNEKDPPLNFEVLIANARKEEKDKLYPRIKKLEDENKQLITSLNAQLLRVGELQVENETLKKNEGGDPQAVKDLKAQVEALQIENKKLKDEAPNVETIRQQIEAEYEVKSYLTQQLTDHKDDILSTFAGDVQGKTKEEIDASVKKAVDKTIEVKKSLGLIDDKGEPINKPKKNEKPPVVNPKGEETETIDIDYVSSLDPKSAEYKEFRKKMGLK